VIGVVTLQTRRMLDYDVAPQGDRLHRVVLECECATEAKRFKHEVLQQIGTDARFDIQPLEGALGIWVGDVGTDKLFDRLEYREEVTSHVVEIGSELDEVVTGPTARDRIAAQCGARGRQVGPVQADRAKWYVES